jgi:hypothetical protein
MLENESFFYGALFERERAANPVLLLLWLCGCAALTFTAEFGAWVLSAPPVAAPQIVVVRAAADSPPLRRIANPYGGLIAFAGAPSPPLQPLRRAGRSMARPPGVLAGARRVFAGAARGGGPRFRRACPRFAPRPSAA